MTALLRTDGIKKAYGGVQALNGASIAVDEGTVAGLIGPNGSGKTTLFNVITGYERIQQGAVRFRGAEITNAPPDRVFGLGIGRTFQLTRLFMRLTVLENVWVRYCWRDSRTRAPNSGPVMVPRPPRNAMSAIDRSNRGSNANCGKIWPTK